MKKYSGLHKLVTFTITTMTDYAKTQHALADKREYLHWKKCQRAEKTMGKYSTSAFCCSKRLFVGFYQRNTHRFSGGQCLEGKKKRTGRRGSESARYSSVAKAWKLSNAAVCLLCLSWRAAALSLSSFSHTHQRLINSCLLFSPSGS